MTEEELVEVRLLGIPLERFRYAQEHHDELFRELALVAAEPSRADTLPRRVISLVQELSRRFSAYTAESHSQRDAALARGDASVDLVLRVPRGMREAALQFDALLEEVDERCRHGEFLTLAPPPDAVAFRRWYLGEVSRQIEGRPPTPWSRLAERDRSLPC